MDSMTTPEPAFSLLRSVRYAQEQQELKEWTKEYPAVVDIGSQRSLRHMNIEQLLSEVGLRFLYDFEAVQYGREDITRVHQEKWDGLPVRTVQDERWHRQPDGQGVPPGDHWHAAPQRSHVSAPLSVYADFGFVNTVLEDIAPLCHTPSIRNDNTQNGTTFADIEADLPDDMQGRLLPICNQREVWGGEPNGWRDGNPSPYTMEDKVEIRHIRHMWLMCDDYMCGQVRAERQELLREDESDEEESEEEEGMSDEERKEMCGKGLEILESIMEKDDQRMGEGHFVELCNLLKDLHRT
jgi:hypothetical protein